MPQLGLGTFLIPNELMATTIRKAYDMGYRQFDTAWRYDNESVIGDALKKNGIKREDVFITTKINAASLCFGNFHYGRKAVLNIRNFKSIRSAILESFENLGTDYVDLFLIHYPYPNSDKIWQELVKLYHEGRIRAIGVSNFLQPHLKALAEISDVVPAVNQFEISPLNTQKELIAYCKEKGIAVEAMSTFSHFRSVEPRKEIVESDKLKAIALHHGKSVVQVVLRWMQQQGIIMIPKTWEPKHLKENISIFDFELNEDEMRTIDSMDRGTFLNYNPFGQQQGFVRSQKDWEGFRKWNAEHKQGKIMEWAFRMLGV